ncbi:47 kDa outer membrane protein precursor [bacterium BMS3Abin12]|nr:47 kDa outer membrane protein precursor [bacterium BMS3Abin12]
MTPQARGAILGRRPADPNRAPGPFTFLQSECTVTLNRLFSVVAPVFCWILVLPSLAYATNGYQLMGIGSYQKSLGGAVTANPGSAMTAITNPAGMARIGTRADFSMEAFLPSRSVDFRAQGGAKEDSDTRLYGIPSLGWTAPISPSHPNVYFGGGMYGTSGMGVDYPVTKLNSTGGTFVGYSNVMFWQMAPTLAWDVNRRLSVGAALNLDYQSVSLFQEVRQGAGTYQADLSRGASAFGVGVGVGILYDLTPHVTLGLAYKSKQFFPRFKYQLRQGDVNTTLLPGGKSEPAGTYTLGLNYPQQVAVGMAVRPTGRLTLSADVKWINWADTMNRLEIHGPAGFRFAIDSGWSNQTVFALGAAYRVNDRLTLRAGYNHGSSPIDDAHASSNLILPAVVENHFAVGGSYALNARWVLSFHFMYAPRVTVTVPAEVPLLGGAKTSLKESSAGLDIGYRF